MGLRATASFKPGDIAGLVSRVAAGAQQGALTAAQAGQAISLAIVPRDTGALADSIDLKSGVDGASAWASWGPDIFYMFYVEFGTGRRGAASAEAGPGPYDENWAGMTPRPYMRPALDEIAPQVVDIVADAIKDAL